MKHGEDLREPTGPGEAEIIVRRSRFLARAIHVTSPDAAQTEIRRVRDTHPDASHVVYAFLIGDPHSEYAGMSDAGEPRGTAGRPVMEILRGSMIRDVLVTIVRYYGGTKLGTGGLVHAYGDVTRSALDRLPTRRRVQHRTGECRLSYELYERMRVQLRAEGAEIRDERFTTDVRLVIAADAALWPRLESLVRDLSRGTVELQSVTDCGSGENS